MKVKKVTSAIVSLFFALVSVTSLSSCVILRDVTQKQLPILETEYFKYSVKKEKDGSKRAYLVGFTELGLEQTALIFPEEIDGIKVWGVGYTLPRWTGDEQFGWFQSEKLERLYFPFSYNEVYWANYNAWLKNAYVMRWYPQADGAAKMHMSMKAPVYGYNLYKNMSREDYYYDDCCVANVSYLYNYDNSPNDGWYWVDSYNETLISFIPPEPEREGYSFAGWYKEPECTTPWDFEHDVTGKELILSVNYGLGSAEVYEGIYLYAKWEIK